MKKKYFQSFLLMALGVCSLSAYCVEPKEFEVNGFAITPSLAIELQSDDNVYSVSSGEESADITTINSNIKIERETESRKYQAELEVYKGLYSYAEPNNTDSDDDYFDWKIAGLAQFAVPDDGIINVNADFFSSHETRGTKFSEGGRLPSEPDRYKDFSTGIIYQKPFSISIGSGVAGRTEVGLDYFYREYTTRRFVTITRDRESTRLRGALYYQVLPTLEVSVEYQQSGIEYLTDPIFEALDSKEKYFYFGAQWQPFENVSGNLNIGQGKKDFRSDDRESSKAPVWLLELDWDLTNHSELNFDSNRRFNESKGTGSSQLSTSHSVDWRYHWSSQISTSLSAELSNDEFGDSTRDDDFYLLGLEVSYSVSRWLDTYFQLIYQERESTFSSYQYDKGIIAIGFDASL